ncbi:hypothetical protein DFH94DRAFT_685901 [Russula ochroleuca]|uniref:Uncharacterized protein n=1 Tax=Russula ochroleuca TaxID=152965 RepID=A0A9P5MP26_9AGAM|nr:hypothetical protein DFH94DRAFT_685901 [Russula ochroleuca]
MGLPYPTTRPGLLPTSGDGTQPTGTRGSSTIRQAVVPLRDDRRSLDAVASTMPLDALFINFVVNELRTRKNGLSRTNQRYRRRSPSCSQSLRALRGEARRLSFGGVDWHGVAQDGRGAGHTFSDATTNPSAEPRLLLLMGSAIGSLDGRHVTFAAAPRGIASVSKPDENVQMRNADTYLSGSLRDPERVIPLKGGLQGARESS